MAIASQYRNVASLPEQTDLGDLAARLEVAGWAWQSARKCKNGWHHLLVQQEMRNHKRLTTARVRELVGDVEAPRATEISPERATRMARAQARFTAADRAASQDDDARRRAAEIDAKLALKDGMRRGAPLPPRGAFTRPRGYKEREVVGIDLVVPGRWQPRTAFDEAGLQELADSIKASGLLNPPLVFCNEKGAFELIAGERRWRASKLAGLEFLPVQILEGTPEQLQAAALIDNIQRADLSPADEGAAYERLIKDLGISEAECARRTGKPRSYIQQRRAIANAAPEVKAAHADGTITLTHARTIALAAPGDHKAQKKALATIVKRLAGGVQISEGQAKSWAEDAVIKVHKKALEELGWKVSDGYGSSTVWSETERPRRWTGAEILEAVREGRRPATGEAPAGASLTSEEAQEARRFGLWTTDTYKPWVGIGAYGDAGRYLSADEVRAELAALEARLASMQQRYAAAGWTLSKGEFRWEARAAEGAYRSLVSWSEIEGFIVELEAGKISGKGAKLTATNSESKQICVRCRKKVADYAWYEEGWHCKPCAAARQEEIAQAKAQIRTRLAEQLCCWLADAPANALRMLIASGRGLSRLYDHHAPVYDVRLREAGEELLRETLLDLLVEVVYASGDRERGFAPPAVEELRARSAGG